MKTYTHNLYLIERTKLLEGILCQSITFTNPIGNDYNKNITVPALVSYKIGGTEQSSDKKEFYKYLYLSPASSSILTIIPPKKISDIIYEKEPLPSLSYISKTSYVTITYNGKTEVYQAENWEEVKITFDGLITISYTLNFIIDSANNRTKYVFTYALNNLIKSYPLKPYTTTDCINRVLDLAEPIFDGETPRYKLNPVQAERFDKIQAPEFTMTQCTLREQLKIIGGYIHAEPRLGGYIEETIQYNGITYKKGYYENMIFFDEYGKGEKSSIANAPYVYNGNLTDISQYCTDIQTNASNIVNSLNYAQGVIIDPDSTNTQTLRTDSINVKLTDSTARVHTQLPIYKIIKVECGLYKEDGSWNIEPIDITPHIYEAHEYHSTMSSYEGNYPYAKPYALYYTQGQKGLDGLFFKSDNAFGDMWSKYAIVNILEALTKRSNLKSDIESNFPLLAFRISYIPIYDAKFSHNKQLIIPTNKKFSQIYNQSENLIETSYYGENIKGVAQRLGNVEQTRTYMLSSISQIPKAGQMLDGYVISAVTTEIMPFYIKCTVALSKDFNRISQYVGINSNKRISEVSERQAYKRDILLKDYIVFTDDVSKYKKDPIAFNNYDAIRKAFGTGITKIKPITACVGESLNYKGALINNTRIKLPVISSSFGNSILFSWQYEDNYSAGKKVSEGDQYQLADGNKTKVTAYWQTDVPYCDYYGRIYKYKFSLFNNTDYLNNDNMYRYIENHIDEILTGLGQEVTDKNREDTLETYHDIIFSEERDPTQEAQYESLVKTFSKAMFEQAKTVAFDLDRALTTNICTQNPYCVRKDSREVLSFSYEVEMVTDQDDIIIGSALASNNPLVSDKNLDGFIYFFNEPINKFAKEIDISKAINKEGLTTACINQNDIYIPFIKGDFKSYAIVTPAREEKQLYEDEQGNVDEIKIQHGGELILARNKPKSDYKKSNYEDEATHDIIYFVATSNPYNE